MIYLKGPDLTVIVLETANLEELQKGRPAVTPDKKVMVCWTPDLVWLADKIADTDGDASKISELIDQAAKRPQKGPRPYHKPHEAKLGPKADK